MKRSLESVRVPVDEVNGARNALHYKPVKGLRTHIYRLLRWYFLVSSTKLLTYQMQNRDDTK